MRRLLLLALAACQSESPTPAAQPPAGKVELVEEPATDDVAALVAREVTRAAADHLRPIVYVGATWCEPCRHFHDAAAAGALDARFGGTRFLVFDLDRDGPALDRAGYRSALVPLFVVPAADGTATGLRIQGSVKGDGAVDQIAPRLRKLLDAPAPVAGAAPAPQPAPSGQPRAD